MVFPEVTLFLFPAAVTDVLGMLAQFGLIFFMFLIGLELDHAMIRGSGHTAVIISHYSIVIPFTLGLAAALVVYPLVGSGDFTGFALFMGASMAITAFPVLARILTDTGLHRTRIGASPSRAPLSTTSPPGASSPWWWRSCSRPAPSTRCGPWYWRSLFVLAMLTLVRPLVARVLAVHDRRGRIGPAVMSMLIVGLFLSAWATEAIGIHAIFGAFMFGAILPRSRTVVAEISSRLEDVTVLFLLPVFFAVVGLSTQIGLVTGAQMWAIAGLIIVIAITGKIGGSVIAGLAAGETLRSSTIIGVLMNAPGITEIVILTIGRGLGVISPALFTIMVMMALVTTFMTTPLLSWLYPRRTGRRRPRRLEVAAGGRLSAPRLANGRIHVTPGSGASWSGSPTRSRPAPAAPGRRGCGLRDGGRPPVSCWPRVVQPAGHEEVRANLTDIEDEAADAAIRLAPARDQLGPARDRSRGGRRGRHRPVGGVVATGRPASSGDAADRFPRGVSGVPPPRRRSR